MHAVPECVNKEFGVSETISAKCEPGYRSFVDGCFSFCVKWIMPGLARSEGPGTLHHALHGSYFDQHLKILTIFDISY